jgi:hypothetical protein
MSWVNWANCANGEVPDSLTVVVGTFGQKELRLNPAAAAAYWAWDAEYFARTGIHIEFSETDRNIATQEYLYDGWVKRKPGFYMAAKPHYSTHGEDTAGDVRSSVYSDRQELHDILVETGDNHGWSWDYVGKGSGEPWHFNFIGDPLSMTVAQYNSKYAEKDWFDMATLNDLKNVIADYFANGEGRDRIGQAIREHLDSADGRRQFNELAKDAIAEYFNGEPGNEGIDRISQGVYKNDTSPDGKAALKAAVS